MGDQSYPVNPVTQYDSQEVLTTFKMLVNNHKTRWWWAKREAQAITSRKMKTTFSAVTPWYQCFSFDWVVEVYWAYCFFKASSTVPLMDLGSLVWYHDDDSRL